VTMESLKMSTQANSSNQQVSARIERLRQYLQDDPDNVPLLRDLAREALSTGQYEDVITAIDRLRDLGSADGNDEAACVYALVWLGRIDQAVACGLQARQSWPDEGAVRLELCRALLRAKRFTEVLEHCSGEFDDTALTQMAGDFHLQALWHLGELEMAVELGSKLVESFPENPQLLAHYSALLYDSERMPEALTMASRAYAISPKLAYSSLHVLASDRLTKQDIKGAMKLLNEAQQLRTDDGRVLLIKGSAELMQGNIDQAVADLEKAQIIFPGHPGTHLTLAWVHITRSQLDEAERIIHIAITASPAFAESHGTLAVVHAMRGQAEEARQCIRRATLLDKDCFAARYAQSLLDGKSASRTSELFKELVSSLKI
jgi:tetratricopeptide (TPR) repeat protein